jgi:hypothetical protein
MFHSVGAKCTKERKTERKERNPRPSMPHQIRRALDVESDDGKSRGHTLECDLPECLGDRGGAVEEEENIVSTCREEREMIGRAEVETGLK